MCTHAKTTKKECKQKCGRQFTAVALLSDLLDLHAPLSCRSKELGSVQVVGIELSQKPIHRQHHTLHIPSFLLLLRTLPSMLGLSHCAARSTIARTSLHTKNTARTDCRSVNLLATSFPGHLGRHSQMRPCFLDTSCASVRWATPRLRAWPPRITRPCGFSCKIRRVAWGEPLPLTVTTSDWTLWDSASDWRPPSSEPSWGGRHPGWHFTIWILPSSSSNWTGQATVLAMTTHQHWVWLQHNVGLWSSKAKPTHHKSCSVWAKSSRGRANTSQPHQLIWAKMPLQ